MSGSGGGDSGFYRGVWRFAGLDATEEIAHVGVCAVLEALLLECGVAIAFDAFVKDAHAGTIQFQGGFGPPEFETAVVDG